MEAAASHILVMGDSHLCFIYSLSQVLPGVVKKSNQDDPSVRLGEKKLQRGFWEWFGRSFIPILNAQEKHVIQQ